MLSRDVGVYLRWRVSGQEPLVPLCLLAGCAWSVSTNGGVSRYSSKFRELNTTTILSPCESDADFVYKLYNCYGNYLFSHMNTSPGERSIIVQSVTLPKPTLGSCPPLDPRSNTQPLTTSSRRIYDPPAVIVTSPRKPPQQVSQTLHPTSSPLPRRRRGHPSLDWPRPRPCASPPPWLPWPRASRGTSG